MADTITAIASLLWPLLVLVLIVLFRKPLSRVVHSAEQREWTLEVGGQRITMNQLSDQQNAMIADLQRQVHTLNDTVARLTAQQQVPPATPEPAQPDYGAEPAYPGAAQPTHEPPSGGRAPGGTVLGGFEQAPQAPQASRSQRAPQDQQAPQAPNGPESPSAGPPGYAPVPPQPSAPVAGSPEAAGNAHPRAAPNAVLWVDDVPENNALIVDQLQRDGVRVDLARSTQEGLALLGSRRYAIVLSDMGRTENGTVVPDAGLRLLRAVRETDPRIPFVIYCGTRTHDRYQFQAMSEGATAITASPTVLTEHLRSAGLL